MKNFEDYLDFLETHNSLTERALAIGKLGKSIYPKRYYMLDDFIRVTFDAEEATIESEETFCGSTDGHWLSFPADWLFLSDEEITDLILAEKAEAERKEAERQAQQIAENKAFNDKKERELYEKLKQKFETLNS